MVSQSFNDLFYASGQAAVCSPETRAVHSEAFPDFALRKSLKLQLENPCNLLVICELYAQQRKLRESCGFMLDLQQRLLRAGCRGDRAFQPARVISFG